PVVVAGRLGALALEVVDAGQQVAGVGAEGGVGEGRELVERLAGGQIVPEEETPEAVVVQGQPAGAALDEQGVGEEGGGGVPALLRLAGPEQHLGLVAAGAGGPLQVGRQLAGVLAGLLHAVGERPGGGGEVAGRLVEALVGGGAALGGLLGPGGGL